MNVFTLSESPVEEQVRQLERGLPGQTLGQIARQLGVSEKTLISSLRFSQRTMTARKAAGERLTLSESERMLRVARVRNAAAEIFTNDAAIAEWLSSPDSALGGRTPLEMLATDIGSRKVENLVQAMAHGVPV